MDDQQENVAMQHKYQALGGQVALNQTQEVNVDTLLKMALDIDQSLTEANKILNEKRTILTGNGNDFLATKDTPDRAVDTLYSVLRRIGNLANASRNIATKL